MRDRHTIVVRLSQGARLGDTMHRLRIWLDAEKIQHADFKTRRIARAIRSQSASLLLVMRIAFEHSSAHQVDTQIRR